MAGFNLVLSVTFVLCAGALDTIHEHIVSMPMHSFAQDCGTKSALHIKHGAVALLQHNNVPGAGIDKFKPFETVLKDGFFGGGLRQRLHVLPRGQVWRQ
jgi:hypothetical protein